MDGFARNPCKDLTDSLDHPVTCFVAMRVIDALKVVDVAKCDAERLNCLLSFPIVGLKQTFECAAIGQSRQVINFRIPFRAF